MINNCPNCGSDRLVPRSEIKGAQGRGYRLGVTQYHICLKCGARVNITTGHMASRMNP